MAERIKLPRNVSKDEFLDQIRAGVFDAMHELMSTGSSSPGDNFYGAIKDGVREAVRATVTAGQLRPAPEPAEGELPK
jgi:hypothetical protein